MATNNFCSKCFFLIREGSCWLFAFFSFIFVFSLEAQVSTGDAVTEQQEPRLVQRLAWKGDQYAVRYEVVIEREENKIYVSVLHEFTDMSFIDVTLSPGKYRLRVTAYDYLDEAGEESKLIFEVRPAIKPKPEQVKRELPFEVYVTAAWLPLLPIYGEAFGENMNLPGLAARVGAVSSNKELFDAGAELTACWYTLDKIINDEHAARQTVTIELNLLAKMRLSNQSMSLGFRLGAGYNLLLGDGKPDSLSDNIYTNIGVSFQWLIVKHLYLETGLDHTHLFTKIPSGGIKPWVGVGWQITNNK